MLKHIITLKCSRDCPYCLTREIGERTESGREVTAIMYRALRSDHSEIMLTGGEPYERLDFHSIARAAFRVFDRVHLTTASPAALEDQWIRNRLASITFSIHDTTSIPKVPRTCDVPVYASILADQYRPWLPVMFLKNGYAGLTINEHQKGYPGGWFSCWTTAPDPESLPPFPGFTYKVNRRGHCMRGTQILMPDLELVEDFEELLPDPELLEDGLP